MAKKKKKKMSEKQWKAANLKPKIPLDVQQSIMGITPETEEKAKKKEEPTEEA